MVLMRRPPVRRSAVHRPLVHRRALVAAAAAPLLLAQASADWPVRPLRFIVPFSAGGNTDVTARLYAGFLTRKLGQPIVVENRSGATGAIGTEAVVRAAPDGYTMLLGSPGSIVNGPLLMATRRYDPITDLVPVALLGLVPMVIAVRASLPVRSLEELVAYSRAQPDGVTIGTSGIGGAHHLPMELFKAQTGARLVHVPYRGGGSTLPDLVAGNVDGVVIELPSVLDLHREGRARILGVAAPARSPLLPAVPTFIEAGVVDFLAASFVGLFAPAATPAAVLGTLQAGITDAVADPELRAKLLSFGADPPTPAQLTTAGSAAYLQGEVAKARRAIAIAGLQPE